MLRRLCFIAAALAAAATDEPAGKRFLCCHDAATAAAFDVLGRIPLGKTCLATPAAAGGNIYFRTASRLFAL